MDIDMVLRERYVSDLRKPEVDNKERALIIKKICETNSWSGREFAKQFGFKHSTVQDWLLWDDERVDELREMGAGETEIYRTLRNNKKAKSKKGGTKKTVEASLVDERVRKMAKEIKTMHLSGEFSTDTEGLLADLVNECNRFSSRIKRESNGHKVNKGGK